MKLPLLSLTLALALSGCGKNSDSVAPGPVPGAADTALCQLQAPAGLQEIDPKSLFNRDGRYDLVEAQTQAVFVDENGQSEGSATAETRFVERRDHSFIRQKVTCKDLQSHESLRIEQSPWESISARDGAYGRRWNFEYTIYRDREGTPTRSIADSSGRLGRNERARGRDDTSESHAYTISSSEFVIVNTRSVRQKFGSVIFNEAFRYQLKN